MNRLLMGLVTLTACSKPVDRGLEIDALKAKVADLEKSIAATKNDVHESTKSIIDGLTTLDLVTADGKPIPRWWCAVNSACQRTKEACEKWSRRIDDPKMRALFICHPARVAFCETRTPQCWPDLESCSLGGGDTCRGAE
jgi:hypothetical protein